MTTMELSHTSRDVIRGTLERHLGADASQILIVANDENSTQFAKESRTRRNP